MSSWILSEPVEGLVSIPVPAYNHENYIDDLLESILNQNYDNIEVLVCDDCSSDSTWEHMQSFRTAMESRGFQYTIWRHEVNQGVCRTMNELLKACRGEYIKSIASDDVLADESSISRYVKGFQAKPDADILVSNACLISESTHLADIDPEKMEKFYKQAPNFDTEGLLESLYQDNFICSPTCCYRRASLDAVGPYDDALRFEDWDFALRAIEVGIRYAYIPDCQVAYRIVSTSLSHGESEDAQIVNLDGNLQTFVKHAAFVDDEIAKKMITNLLYLFYIKAKAMKWKSLEAHVREAEKETGYKLSLAKIEYMRFKSFVRNKILRPSEKKNS